MNENVMTIDLAKLSDLSPEEKMEIMRAMMPDEATIVEDTLEKKAAVIRKKKNTACVERMEDKVLVHMKSIVPDLRAEFGRMEHPDENPTHIRVTYFVDLRPVDDQINLAKVSIQTSDYKKHYVNGKTPKKRKISTPQVSRQT